jgi:hypothetical protein
MGSAFEIKREIGGRIVLLIFDWPSADFDFGLTSSISESDSALFAGRGLSAGVAVSFAGIFDFASDTGSCDFSVVLDLISFGLATAGF